LAKHTLGKRVNHPITSPELNKEDNKKRSGRKKKKERSSPQAN